MNVAASAIPVADHHRRHSAAALFFLRASIGLATLLLCATAMEQTAQAGYLYVADQAAGIIYRLDGSGDKTVFASGLEDPSALAADGSGNIYVAAGNGIFEYAPNGTQSTFYRFGGMFGLAVNASGDVFGTVFGDIEGESSVFEYSPSGQSSLLYNLLTAPNAVAIDASGNVYVADYGNGKAGGATIREFMPDVFPPYWLEFAYASGLNGADGLAFNKAGDLFEADGLDGTINEFTPAGNKLTYYSTGLETDGLAIDPAGDLFVLDGAFGSGQVTEITAGGAERTFASSFENPSSIVYAVPEPAPVVLMASAAALLACFWAKRRRTGSGARNKKLWPTA